MQSFYSPPRQKKPVELRLSAKSRPACWVFCVDTRHRFTHRHISPFHHSWPVFQNDRITATRETHNHLNLWGHPQKCLGNRVKIGEWGPYNCLCSWIKAKVLTNNVKFCHFLLFWKIKLTNSKYVLRIAVKTAFAAHKRLQNACTSFELTFLADCVNCVWYVCSCMHVWNRSAMCCHSTFWTAIYVCLNVNTGSWVQMSGLVIIGVSTFLHDKDKNNNN